MLLFILWLAVFESPATASPAVREITITARQYGYEPHRIVVDAGDTIRLRLVSLDVVHGFYLEGHDLDARIFPGRLGFERRTDAPGHQYQQLEEVVIHADRPGKYRYRCSISCGTLHPFMQGELIVRPNMPFLAGAAGLSLIVLGTLASLFVPVGARTRSHPRIDLLERFPPLRWLVTRRWFQFAIVFPNLLVLVFFIAAGLFGSPIGNRNIIVTIVWILWWFLLITLMVPLGGRAWCLACPIPFFGEWLGRGRIIEAQRPEDLQKKRRWPFRSSGIWTQNVLFLALCSVSTILVTRPALTAFVLILMIAAALIVHLLFERRTFCRYLCPLNGWMSVYSMNAVTELRARDPQVCTSCGRRSCVRGTEAAWGCPWMEVPFRLDRNNYCGLCMECVKACPNGNLTVNVRPFAADRTIRGLDEAWMAFIMIALAIAYSVTLLGPWRTIRDWANVSEVGDWGGFAIHTSVVWFVALVLIPAIWYAASLLSSRWLGADHVGTRQLFIRSSFMLVPFGLMAWVAFSLPLLMINYTHINSSLSDPLGVGWNLFGTANQRWEPLAPVAVPYIQAGSLLIGLLLAISSGRTIAGELLPGEARAAYALLPHAAICGAVTLILLRLYAG